MLKIAIVQYRLLHYRLRLFEMLRDKLLTNGVELILVCGQASDFERSRRDEGQLPWATMVKNKFVRIRGKDILWQPLPASVQDAALIIVMQENRLISNYFFQIRSLFGGPLIGFWGHGRNYQSESPHGLRERWKKLWLKRVDWWFAYTDGARRYVASHGFPESRITILENAIDSSGFQEDLDSITPAEIAQVMFELSITIDSRVAIYCGSIYKGKRMDVLLESADLLRDLVSSFHLLVIGEGPESSYIREAAASRPWIHTLGPRKGREKALYYRISHVMLNPGLVGLHIVDAFVAKTPLITQASSSHGPEYDYLRQGENGISVLTDDAAAYANAVGEVLNDPTRLMAMRAECAVDAKRFTVENMVDNFVAGILDCLKANDRFRRGQEARN